MVQGSTAPDDVGQVLGAHAIQPGHALVNEVGEEDIVLVTNSGHAPGKVGESLQATAQDVA